jgi:hypothetical protein
MHKVETLSIDIHLQMGGQRSQIGRNVLLFSGVEFQVSIHRWSVTVSVPSTGGDGIRLGFQVVQHHAATPYWFFVFQYPAIQR